MVTREQKLFDALKRITHYYTSEYLHKHSEEMYGLSGDEAVEMAYDNVLADAKQTIKGMRRPT